jgi:hypothetical protein
LTTAYQKCTHEPSQGTHTHAEVSDINMNPYPLWYIWRELPLIVRGFCLALFLVSIYTLYSAFTIIVRLRALTGQPKSGETPLFQHSLVALQRRSANLRQLLNAAFYLFGFVFFLASPWTTMILDESRTPVINLILRNFLDYLAFAADVFSVFLVLHCVQWFVSSRVLRCLSQLHCQAD